MGVRGKIEAVIYAAEEPVTLAQLASLFGVEALAEQAASGSELAAPFTGDEPAEGEEVESAPAEDALKDAPLRFGDPDADKRAKRLHDRLAREAIRVVLAALMAEYDASDRGMEIREIAGGYRVATKPEYHDAVRGFAKSLKPPMKLTLQALETLAVIAYKQPVTAPEVSEIRGVDSGGVLGSLIGRKLVTTAGRKQVIGRPILYKTTREFLLRFGLKDLSELPSMEEFEKMAGELQGMSEEPESSEQAVSLLVPAAETVPESAPGGPKQVGETPRLAPLAIEVTVEELPAVGISVNKSGVPVADDAQAEEER